MAAPAIPPSVLTAAGISAAGGALSTSYVGQVATHAALSGVNGANFQMMSRSRHFARDRLTQLKIIIPNWYIETTGGTEAGPGGTATVTASVEYPTGTFTQIKFAGVASGTIANGAQITSDYATVTIPEGAKFYIRIYYLNASGILYRSNGWTASGGDTAEFSTTGITDKTMSGTVGGTPGYHFPPVAILAPTNRVSFTNIGDSRGVGVGDTGDRTDDIGNMDRSIGPYFAYTNLCTQSDRMQWFANNSRPNSAALILFSSHVLCAYGTNDMVRAGRTAAQVQTDLETIAAAVSPKPIYQLTVSCESTSTDGWVTTANQTTKASNSVVVTFNTALRNSTVKGISGYCDTAAAVENVLNGGIWKAGYTADGIHENNTGCLAILASGAIDSRKFVR